MILSRETVVVPPFLSRVPVETLARATSSVVVVVVVVVVVAIVVAVVVVMSTVVVVVVCPGRLGGGFCFHVDTNKSIGVATVLRGGSRLFKVKGNYL